MFLLVGWRVRRGLVGWLEGEDVFLFVGWRVRMCSCWLAGG